MKSPWSSYVDDRGRSPDMATLGEEIAVPTLSGVRRVIGDAVASGLTPERLAQVLRQSAIGDARAYLTLAEEMEERYLHYASQLQTRRLAIEGVPVSVEHDERVPAKIVDAVNALVEDSGFEPMIGMLTDGIAKGYSAVEIAWEFRDGLRRPTRYIWRDPRFFVFDELTQTELRLASDNSRDGLPLPAARFIVHVPRSKAGIPIRRGMARPAAWAFMIQSFSLRDWASFAEIYGVPLRIGKYHANASDADKRSLLYAVRAIAVDAAAIMPQGMEILFEKVEGQHGAAVFGGLIDYVDKQVSKLVLGQTMTSDDGASLAQAEVHDRVRLDILQADAKQIAATINRDLMRPFVDMNFGPQAAYPRVTLPVAEPEDIKGLTEAVARLVPLGLRVSQREMLERVGLSEPKPDELVLGAPPAAALPTAPGAPAAKPARVELSASAPVDGVEEVEQLAADALADWQDITDPLLDPIRRIMTRATSLEEAIAMLDADGPDASRLAEVLARKTAIARGIGDVRD